MLSSGEQNTCRRGRKRKQEKGGEQSESIRVEKENDERHQFLA
jgi:hypothetical protein